MSAMITFAANNEFFRKRKRVHRACEACKKRRKRCSHTFDDDADGCASQSGTAPLTPLLDPRGFAPTSGQTQRLRVQDARGGVQAGDSRAGASHDGRPGQGGGAGAGAGAGASQSPSTATGDESRASETPPNFMGYLNPEAVFRETVHAERGKTAQSPPAVEVAIGHWIEGREGRSPLRASGGPVEPRGSEIGTQSTQAAKVSLAHQQYLDAVGVDLLPPRKSQDVLVDIYFEYVHPLLPLVDKELFCEQYAQGKESRLLMQALCIVSCKHADAAPYLYMSDGDPLLTPRDFSQRLYNTVIIGIEAKLETNRIVLIQVLTLISLHCEGPDGAEQASMHLAQAIHHAHTFGLQLGFQWKGQPPSSQHKLRDIFWCLWSLDKINACMNGRPLMMHERDNMFRQLPTDPEERASPFGIWLQISEMLDKVIGYYRPGSTAEETGWEGDDFLGFEEMVGDGEDRLEGPITSLLSVFHHTMCMASHKSLSINAPVKSTPSYVRQSLSATRVIHLFNAEAPEKLPPLPLVPYALGVALSVVYRHFRSRRLKVHVNRATEELRQCVQLLDRLRNAWWSAGTMADLGRAVLSNAAGRSTTTGANTPVPTTASLSRPDPNASIPQILHLSTTGLSAPSPLPQAPHAHWTPHLDTPIDPRLHPLPPTQPSLSTLLTPGQHPTSSERAPLPPLAPPPLTSSLPAPNHIPNTAASPGGAFAATFATETPTPDWLNFDAAFENFEGLLGSSGADLSIELLGPLGYEGVWEGGM